MKSTTILFFAALSLSIFPTIKSVDYKTEHHDDFLFACCKPLDLTQPRTVHHFLRNIFSDKRYAYEYLPYNLCSHLMQFLEHGKASGQKAIYMDSALRLFFNKLKACSHVCPHAYSEMLDKAPALIKDFCSRPAPDLFLSTIEKNMMGIFVPTFLSQFSFFKSNPEEFFKNLSHEVSLMVANSFDVIDQNAQEQLKQIFVRFLDLGLIKLIWSPTDQSEVWGSIRVLSKQLYDVMDMGLITPDELDDLYKSLLESFCRFLDIAGSDLSLELIAAMKDDVESGTLFMFELEEQDEFIETKRERMLDALLETEAKIEARMCGIITDVVLYN